MEKYVSFDKLSKKEKKRINSQKRNTWTINPITRKTENPGEYKRTKTRLRDFDEFSEDVSFDIYAQKFQRSILGKCKLWTLCDHGRNRNFSI